MNRKHTIIPTPLIGRSELEQMNHTVDPIPRRITPDEWSRHWPNEPYPETFAATSSPRRGKGMPFVPRKGEHDGYKPIA